MFRDYARSFVHEYGEACGKTGDKNKINSALSKIINFIKEDNTYYGYWMFYSLIWYTKIDFETYLNMYKLFENEIDIQGNLLLQYRKVNKEEAGDCEMIRLLDASSDECIKKNWYMAIDYDFFHRVCTILF